MGYGRSSRRTSPLSLNFAVCFRISGFRFWALGANMNDLCCVYCCPAQTDCSAPQTCSFVRLLVCYVNLATAQSIAGIQACIPTAQQFENLKLEPLHTQPSKEDRKKSMACDASYELDCIHFSISVCIRLLEHIYAQANCADNVSVSMSSTTPPHPLLGARETNVKYLRHEGEDKREKGEVIASGELQLNVRYRKDQ
jgi:hypothetical protein